MATLLHWVNCHGVRHAPKTAQIFHRLNHNLPVPPNTTKQKGKKPPSKFRHYVVSRYVQYMDHYEKIVESKFPKAMHIYRIFKVGIKDFYSDLKTFVNIVKRLNNSPDGLRSLTRKEIELYYQMPKDMKKVAPGLILAALPLANYVMFPLMYLFPRQLLCSHFWSLQQRMEFAVHAHRKKLLHYRPTFRALQAELDNLEDNPLYCDWSRILGLLGSGVHPKPEDILKCIDLFRGKPYHLPHMHSGHIKSLLRVHGMHTGWLRQKRLSDRALIIRHMDLAILREQGPEKMTQDELRWACFLRGLNPVNMRNEDLVEWLKQWLIISVEVDKGSLSLLLHCPILLAYNHPTNWSLIY